MYIKLSKAHYDEMIKQAKEEFPLECCGLLAGIKEGDDLLIKKIYPLVNIDQSSEHFSMDTKEQFAAIKKMRQDGHLLVGNYHSHPYSPSRPSEEDKRLAYDDHMIYGILSLMDQAPVLHFFKITGNKLTEKLEYVLIE